MTESEATQLMLTSLRRDGWMCFKLCDRVTVGLPDVTASKSHKTWWLEAKLVKVRTYQERILWSSLLKKPHERAQLANMVRLYTAAESRYVLFQALPREHRVYLVSPLDVLLSVRSCTALQLDDALDLSSNWLR